MPVSVTCPPVERLQDLAVGRVGDADLESLGSHVLECSRCGETIARLHVTDTIADALHAVPQVRVELPRGMLEAAIQQACQLAEQTSAEAKDDTQSSLDAQDGTGGGATSRQTDLPFDPSEILAPPRSPDELGRLGSYRVLRLLGAGGMGLVFLAEDERLKRPVAIKAIRPSLAAARDSRQRFLREARAAAALRHDHIVTVHQVGAHGGTLWLAMELLEGESLHARLHLDQRLTPLEAVRIARQIADALAAAHSLGLVHRDIKPANVWLENRTSRAGERLPPRVKVLDFGLARTAAEDAQITQSGVIVGTPAYMAPEQARGDYVDAKCDLFSLGCVLYRMLAGHAPFRGKETMAVLMALATHNPPPVRSLAPDVPDELDELTSRLLAKSPADRPHTATAVACALAAIEAQIVSPPPPVLLPEGRGETPSSRLNTRKPLTRVRWLIASAIASLVGCLALAGVLLQIATPVGTIVLEVDQPELVGAVVTVDDKQSITIKTKDSSEPIKVAADEKQHLLKVEKGGFATFTHAFTVQSGKTQTIRVRLQPLQAGGDTSPVLREPTTTDTPSIAVVASVGGLTNPSPRPSELMLTGHEGKVSAVLLAPHRKLLLTGGNSMHKVLQGKTLVNYPGGDNTVRFWNLQTGIQASLIKKGLGQRLGWQIQGLALSPDAAQIAVSSGRPGADFCEATVTVWKLDGQARLHHFALPGRPGVKAPWFDLDGRTLFAFRHDTTLHKLDLTTGTETSAAKLDPNAAEGALTSVCMSADRKSIFGGMQNGLIQVWSVSDGKKIKELRGHTTVVRSLSVTTDGRYLAAASNDRTARIWDLELDQCIRQCTHDAQVSAVEFAGGNHRIVTGDVAGGVHVWDVDSASLLKRLDGHKDAILCLAVSPDGNLLVTGSADKTARTWVLP
jgi:serine/threonine protein kinase/WD40 repeat protein